MLWLGLHMIMAAQAAVQAPAPGPAPTLQQQFDAASDAVNLGQCAEAIQMFETLEANPAVQRNPTVAATIAVRKGRCLITAGRFSEGETTIRRGLPILSGKDGVAAEDVREGHISLGMAAMLRLDYDSAATEMQAALALSTGMSRLTPLTFLSQILAFDGDGQALRYATEAQTIATTAPDQDKKFIARVQTLRARALLNSGQYAEAYALLRDSLAKQGGLNLKVGRDDLATRSDLAIAAMLNDKRGDARRYLAYTGAGRFEKSPFTTARTMRPPLCGVDGVTPDDVAIIEFAVDEDGSVSGVMPIYTRGNRDVALAFARAVLDWSWSPDDTKAIPVLFRTMTRVELRCTRAEDRPDIYQPLVDATARWLRDLPGGAASTWSGVPAARAAVLQRTAIDAARQAGDRPALLGALIAIGDNRVIPSGESTAALTEAAHLADDLNAPATVRTLISLLQIHARDERKRWPAQFRLLLGQADLTADPLAVATIRLAIVARIERPESSPEAATLLDAVIDDGALPARHPLKVNALLHRADILAANKDLVGAHDMFTRTGLTEEQCALLGLTPVMRSSGASSSDYPMAAFEMGFEGWVKTEYDIAANGTTVAPRVTIAYPPYIFNDAGLSISRDTRYASSYRPSGDLTCSANTSNINFLMSQRR